MPCCKLMCICRETDKRRETGRERETDRGRCAVIHGSSSQTEVAAAVDVARPSSQPCEDDKRMEVAAGSRFNQTDLVQAATS